MRKAFSRISVLIVSTTLFFSTNTIAQSQVAAHYDDILHNVGKMIKYVHYSPQSMDDAFSAKVFKTYFEVIDQSRMIFTEKDIQSFKSFEKNLDDEVREGKVEFFKAVNKTFIERIKENKEFVDKLLSKPIALFQDGEYTIDRDSVEFPKTVAEKNEVWKQYLTYEVLSKYNDYLDDKKADSLKNKIDTATEAAARRTVKIVQERNFQRLQAQLTEEENFSVYVNTIVHLMDPHSNYFLPVEKRAFQEDLSGIYYGIGAVLQDGNGQVKVGELMIGGPAWRSRQVEAGDIIVGVATDGEKVQTVEGMAMSEVIKLIRGKKGTKVLVAFKKADGTTKKVSMERDALQLEDTFVKSAVINDSAGKIGYIFLPKFYTSFGDENGRSCAYDVAREILKLKAENVNGIIVDIRNNGGGSLGEVIRMVGLFMKEGPVVQVKGRGVEPEADGVKNKIALYDGPLLVMVNELSASASEIFAAAIQDYKRGVIVGSSSTYGKGTVQRPFGIPDNKSNGELGTLHLTIQKYYRINGGATQLKGITPDIVLPGFYQFYQIQEKYNSSALPWDEIRKANYTVAKDTGYLPVLRTRSNERQAQNDNYATLYKNIDWLTNSGNVYSLNFEKFREEKKKLQETIREVRNSSQVKNELDINNTKADQDMLASREKFRIENNRFWLQSLKKDFYLNESLLVMKDLIQVNTSLLTKK